MGFIGKGANAPRWNGGRTLDRHGYVLVYAPDHPRAHRGHVREHILIAERALGRSLPVEHPVHHVDENKGNNHPSNLVICESAGYHALLHKRADAYHATGHADWLRCCYCTKYDDPQNLSVSVRPEGQALAGRTDAYHKRCAAERVRRNRASNPPKPCRICGQPIQSLGLCSKHLVRLKRHGDPFIVNGRRVND